MDLVHGAVRYISRMKENDMEGWCAMELEARRQDSSSCAARVVFWDASGEFCVETFGAQVPLTVFELLIREARIAIPAA